MSKTTARLTPEQVKVKIKSSAGVSCLFCMCVFLEGAIATFDLKPFCRRRTCSPASWTSAGKRRRRRASSWRWEGGRGCDGGRLSAPGPSAGWRERTIKTLMTLTSESESEETLFFLYQFKKFRDVQIGDVPTGEPSAFNTATYSVKIENTPGIHTPQGLQILKHITEAPNKWFWISTVQQPNTKHYHCTTFWILLYFKGVICKLFLPHHVVSWQRGLWRCSQFDESFSHHCVYKAKGYNSAYEQCYSELLSERVGWG